MSNDLEKICDFAKEKGINEEDVSLLYGQYKKLDRMSGKNNAYERTINYIEQQSKKKKSKFINNKNT